MRRRFTITGVAAVTLRADTRCYAKIAAIDAVVVLQRGWRERVTLILIYHDEMRQIHWRAGALMRVATARCYHYY